MFVKKLQEKFPQSEEQLHCMLAKSGYQYNWKIGLGFPTESRKLFGEISWLFKALICTGRDPNNFIKVRVQEIINQNNLQNIETFQ